MNTTAPTELPPQEGAAPLPPTEGIWWQAGEFLFWSAGSTVLALNQVKVIVAALTAVYGEPGNAPPAILQNLTLVSPVFPLFLGVVALIRLARIGRGGGPLFGFRRATLPGDVRLGLGAGFLACVVTLVSLKLLSPHFALPPFARFPWHYHLYFATVGALVPGVFEEVYFRGLLFRCAPRLPPVLALVLGAAAFALWHIGSPVYLIHTFLLGLLLGLLYLRSGRLAPCMIAHVTANAGFGLLLLAGYSPG